MKICKKLEVEIENIFRGYTTELGSNYMIPLLPWHLDPIEIPISDFRIRIRNSNVCCFCCIDLCIFSLKKKKDLNISNISIFTSKSLYV